MNISPYHHDHIAISPWLYRGIAMTISPWLYRNIAMTISPYSHDYIATTVSPYHHDYIAMTITRRTYRHITMTIALNRHDHIAMTILPYRDDYIAMTISPYRHDHTAMTIVPYRDDYIAMTISPLLWRWLESRRWSRQSPSIIVLETWWKCRCGGNDRNEHDTHIFLWWKHIGNADCYQYGWNARTRVPLTMVTATRAKRLADIFDV